MTSSFMVGVLAVALFLFLAGLADIARNGRPFDPRMLSRRHRRQLGAAPHGTTTVILLAVAAVALVGSGTVSLVTRADGSHAIRIDTTPLEQLVGSAP